MLCARTLSAWGMRDRSQGTRAIAGLPILVSFAPFGRYADATDFCGECMCTGCASTHLLLGTHQDTHKDEVKNACLVAAYGDLERLEARDGGARSDATTGGVAAGLGGWER